MYKKRLIDIRTKCDLKQKEISKLLGLGNEVYGHYEREETIIPIKHLNYVCNYFNVSLDYVFEFCDVLNYKNAVPTISKELQRERLKQLRNEYGLTQQELADSINVGKSTIGDYERMAKIIATPFLYDICRKYNISADYLLGKIDEPKYIRKWLLC